LIQPLKISIAILCGGKSSRFEGDKTKTIFRTKPLYRVIWDRLKPKSNEIFLQVRSEEEYNLPAKKDVLDVEAPLGGIYSALVNSSCAWVFVSACDLPLIDPSIVEILANAVSTDTTGVVPRWRTGYHEPLVALYHVSLIPVIEEVLNQDIYKITELIDLSADIKSVIIDDLIEEGKISSQCFYNVNTKRDLKELELR